jgi:hypothetical protein
MEEKTLMIFHAIKEEEEEEITLLLFCKSYISAPNDLLIARETE